MIKKIFFLLIVFVFSFNLSAFALNTEWGLKIKTRPDYPNPGDYVYVTVESYSMDLSASTITYYLNGEKKLSAIGARYFNFKLPKSNQKTTLRVIATDLDEKTEVAEKVFQPMSVDLVYESVGAYKPLLYKGKAEALSFSELNFFAFPSFYNENGDEYDPKSLIYDWYIDGKKQVFASGLGKDNFHLKKLPGYPLDTKVEVRVRTLDGVKKAVRALKFEPPMSPKLRFYYDDGIYPFSYNNIVKNGQIKSDSYDIAIWAIPYFSNIVSFNNIEWYVNKNRIYLLKERNPLRMKILRNKKNILYNIPVSFKMENSRMFLQSVDGKILLSPTQKIVDNYLRANRTNEEEEGYKFKIEDFLNP